MGTAGATPLDGGCGFVTPGGCAGCGGPYLSCACGGTPGRGCA